MNYSIFQQLINYTGIENHDHLYVLSLHLWLLILVGIELGKATARSTIWKLPVPFLFILSFLILIIAGSSLLMLPEMTINGNGISFIDALFTSISANCVTGLIVVDTATYFSIKGHVLILILIQLGGLNIIAFATYFITFFRKKVQESRDVHIVKEILHADNLQNSKRMITSVILTSFFIEFIGALLIYQQWEIDHPNKVFDSVFHSISAFNNAGFTLFTDGLTNTSIQSNLSLHVVIGILIILGGIGFTTLQELFNLNRFKNSVRNLTGFSMQSKIAIYSSLILIVVGACLFMIFEYDIKTIGDSTSKKIVTSLFQSITARTAGFNTVNYGKLSMAFLILTILFMFIGASSGSTGGGIKTSTISVLLLSFFKRKSKEINYGQSFLTIQLVNKAKTILWWSLGTICLGTSLLLFTEPNLSFMDLLFEEVSAFGTVGLSTGVTFKLSSAGKVIVMTTMFIGRIGPLALAYSLIGQFKPNMKTCENEVTVG